MERMGAPSTGVAWSENSDSTRIDSPGITALRFARPDVRPLRSQQESAIPRLARSCSSSVSYAIIRKNVLLPAPLSPRTTFHPGEGSTSQRNDSIERMFSISMSDR